MLNFTKKNKNVAAAVCKLEECEMPSYFEIFAFFFWSLCLLQMAACAREAKNSRLICLCLLKIFHKQVEAEASIVFFFVVNELAGLFSFI